MLLQKGGIFQNAFSDKCGYSFLLLHQILIHSHFNFYLFLSVLDLHCFAQVFSSRCEWALLFITVHQLLMLGSIGSRHAGFSCCGRQSQQLWCMSLVCSAVCGIFLDQGLNPWTCTGRWICIHSTREACLFIFLTGSFMEQNF